MHPEVGDRHLPRRNERDRAREQTDDEERARERLDHAGRAEAAHEVRRPTVGAESAKPPEEFLRAVGEVRTPRSEAQRRMGNRLELCVEGVHRVVLPNW
jgi:hypothetical protein